MLAKDAREAAFTAAHIEYALAAQVAQVFANQLDVINARIYGRRKVLVVARRFVEAGLNARSQFRCKLRGCKLRGRELRGRKLR